MPARKKMVGIPWFTSDGYDAARALMTDGADLPEQYSDWLLEAEEVFEEAEAAGHRALKVTIDAREFPAWCRARNLAPDGKARVRFANFVAFREAGFEGANTERVLRGVNARAPSRRR
ncbi:MAG: hypothetical protein ABI191_08420 [Rhizomicrobium sp.]